MGKLSTSGLIYDSGSPCNERRREHISILKESNACCIFDPATMGVYCNYTSSILLCVEDNSSILVFDGDEELGINRKAQRKFKASEVAAAIALAVLGNANKLLIDNVLNHCAYMEKISRSAHARWLGCQLTSSMLDRVELGSIRKCIGSPHSKPKDDACSQYRTDEE
ncbi:hypothetical protein HPP92_026590 [Vanilla planifolia]|uniref:Uncharacterized protein n=1 Tax=Vanilla planifolia TaxID=51239 RepID=A0A835PCD9_VANPL|nr:hypothetical protein HPP92_026590 [Vanilla planifolia]